MFKTKKKFLVVFLSLIVSVQYSCKKDTTEPTDNVSIAEEMYSVGAKSVTSDIIQTSDGGYLMVGTSYASNNVEGDIVAIKTDSRGIQQWSTLMGKPSGAGTGSLAGKIVKYHEEGVKVAEAADGSYTIAANRTYISYANNASSIGVRNKTKIVFYKLSATGTATTADGVELRSSSEFTDEVSDFKIDGNQYVLTGFTTDVQANKPDDINNGADDLTDIFTLALDGSFNALWSASSSVYGFPGEDYGTSIQIMSNGYLVVGTSEEQLFTSTSNDAYSPRFITILVAKTDGTPLNVNYFGNPDYELEGGYSVYDATNGLTTIVGNTTAISNAFPGQLVVFQIDNSQSIQTPNPSNTNTHGFEIINPSSPSTTNSTFKANSIALIPNNGGFAISSTLSDNLNAILGKDICITKLASDFSLPATGWPYYYGTSNNTSELAGPVIPMVDANGTIEYAYTGTFNANTSTSQIGWVLF